MTQRSLSSTEDTSDQGTEEVVRIPKRGEKGDEDKKPVQESSDAHYVGVEEPSVAQDYTKNQAMRDEDGKGNTAGKVETNKNQKTH